MKASHVKKLRESLAVLVGLPVRNITRAADMLSLQFGDLVEARAAVRGPDGKLTVGSSLVGEYALQIQCAFRLTCGNRIIAAKSDLYQLSRSAAAELGNVPVLPDDFDYDAVGNNRLDEALSELSAQMDSFIVRSVGVSRFGDVRLRFGNGFELTATADVSGSEECWRFFRSGEEHLIATGQGVETE